MSNFELGLFVIIIAALSIGYAFLEGWLAEQSARYYWRMADEWLEEA